MSSVSKVVFGNTTVMDITDSTVDSDTLLTGTKAYGANGDPVIGGVVKSWTGTATQYAEEASQIPDGTQVNILDDFTPVGIPIGIADIYSSAEREVGVWVDGKPVYQKTVSDSVPSDMDINIQGFTSTRITKGTTLSSLIPILTGSVPNVNCSSVYRTSDYDGWYAFDSDATGTDWSTAYNDTESWIQWTFSNPVFIDNVSIKSSRAHNDKDTITKLTILGQNLITDDWETLLELTPSVLNYEYTEESINNTFKNTCYKAIKLQHSRTVTNNKNAYLTDFRVNGYEAQVTKYTTYRYTKTTDTPGSGKYVPSGAPAVHYSTDEQIIGTWTDGSTLYEKTYEITTPSVAATPTAVIEYPSNFAIKHIDGLFNNANPINIYRGANYYTATFNNKTNHTIDVEVKGISVNVSGIITLQYTKSTT